MTGEARHFDEKMIADLREWRSRITPAPSEAERSAGHPYSVQLRLEEVDALLAAVADRDALRRDACAMPDERPSNVSPIRTARYFGEARVVPVDLATIVDARVEEGERVIAWDQIAAHPFFRECYGTKASLLDAMLAKLTASTFTADIPDEIRERAGERRTVNCRCSVTPILHGHPAEDEVSIEISAEIPRAGSTALGIPYERPKLRDVIADALGEGACSCYESVPKQVERIALAIEREIAAGGIS